MAMMWRVADDDGDGQDDEFHDFYDVDVDAG